jgi:hypothetical protein
MEPVILLITITAIISGTIVRIKKLNLERERMRLMAGQQPEAGVLQSLRQQLPPSINSKAREAEYLELKKRLENLETIVVDGMEHQLMNGTGAQVQRELKEISERLRRLEQ